MAIRTAAAKRPNATGPMPIDYEPRSAVYGGLVGQMIGEIDTRMAIGVGMTETRGAPEDFVHAVSVACGYVGLIMGFGAAAAGIFLLL